jgi:long-chain fatty acid transport protein
MSTEATVDAENNYFFLPTFHGSYRVHPRFSVGLGVYVPYGLTTEWPNTVTVGGQETGWWGRSLVEEISLQTFFLNPTVAANLHSRIQLGAGLTIVKAAVELDRRVTMSSSPEDDLRLELSGGDWGFGATAGLLVRILPDLLNAGVTYRSGVGLTFDGTAVFTKNGAGADVPASLRTRLTDGPATAKLTLPHVVSFGVGAFPLRELTLGFAVDVITWSVYEELRVEFRPTAEDPNRAQLTSSEPKNWDSTVAIRVGAEYRLLNRIPLRVGFIFDQSPEPATTIGPELPDGDRYEFTLGAGYEIAGLRIDAAYQFLTTGDIQTADTAPLVGRYVANAHLAGLSLSYGLSL